LSAEIEQILPQVDLWDSLELVQRHRPIEQPPSTATFIVFTKANRYYVKDGRTGRIVFEEPDPNHAERVLQAAIDALPVIGGKILIKRGIYNLASTILIDSKCVTLAGEGAGWAYADDKYTPEVGATILKVPSDFAGNVIEIKGTEADGLLKVSGSRVTNLKIFSPNNQNTTNHGIRIFGGTTGANQICIDHVMISGVGGVGIFSEGAELRAVNNVIRWTGTMGIAERGGDSYVAFNIIGGAGRPKYDAAGWQVGWFSESDGIYGGGGSIYIGNYSYGNARYGLHLDNVWYTLVVGNRLTTNGGGGIVTGGATRIGHLIASNQCIDNGRVSAWGEWSRAGMALTSNWAVIADNHCYNVEGGLISQQYGLWLGDCTDLIIVNNLIRNVPTPVRIYGTLTGVRIKGNLGYPTDSFKTTAQPVEIGVSDVYGAATEITSPSWVVSHFRLKVNIGGTFATGETITVKVECVWEDGTVTSVEKAYTATGVEWLSDDDMLTLWQDKNTCRKVNVYAKTNLASTTVTCSVDVLGAG